MLALPLSAATRAAIELVVIGASAGGVAALLRLLPGLPAGYALPIVIVLHMPAHGESRFGELLQRRVDMRVREARDKEPIASATIYLAVADHHLSVELDRSLSLSGEEPVRYSRPSIDLLMESAALAYGPALLGVLLSGANTDGARGLAAIKAAGGISVVQDPLDAEISTMPRAAIAMQGPDLILPLNQIHQLLLSLGEPR
ncbi:MAG: chemotaxis protein CheB [Burkholderiaceae bacterium]